MQFWRLTGCLAVLWVGSSPAWGVTLPSGEWIASSNLNGYPGQPYQQILYDDQIWIIGHHGASLQWSWTYDHIAEIHVSEDGINWQAGPEWPFSEPGPVKAVVFRGELYAFWVGDESSRIQYVVYDPESETWGTQRTWSKGAVSRYHDFNATVEVAATDAYLWFLEAADPPKLWRSDDGTTWKRIATHLPFGPRLHYRLLATEVGLAVMGGAVTNRQDERLTDYKRTTADYWFSPDGVQWKFTSSPWSTRGEMNIQRIGGVYYMVGGQNLLLNHSDLWFSFDGRTWHMHCFDCPWGPLVYPLIVPFGDTIRIVGGAKELEAQYDVWSNVAPSPPRTWIATSDGVTNNSLSIMGIKSIHGDFTPDFVTAVGAASPAYDIERSSVNEDEWRMWLPLPEEGGDVAVEVTWTDGEQRSEIIPSALYRSPLIGEVRMVGGFFGFAPHQELNGTSLAWNFEVIPDPTSGIAVRQYAEFVRPVSQYAKQIHVGRSTRGPNEYQVSLIDLQRISLPSPREAFPFAGMRLTNSIAYDSQGNISRDNIGAASTYFMPRALVHPRVTGINNGYFSGEENVIEVSLSKAAFSPPLGALSVIVHLPEHWRYTRSIASTGTAIHPQAGTENTLEFAWIQVPTFPVRLRIAVEVPESESEPQVVTAVSQYYLEASGGANLSPQAQYIFLGPGEVNHTADQNGDGSISFSELLRTIQLYNSGAYHVNPDSEDGFAPGAGPTNGLLHRGNYKLHEWAFDLSELLRMIQLYNSRGYESCIDGEDGFCPVDS